VLVPRGAAVEAALEDLGNGADGASCGRWRVVYRDEGYSVFMRGENADGLPVVDRTGQCVRPGFP
jgi:hypothetical protein